MKRALILTLAVVAALPACQKQQTEEERKAEVEREVQNRLAAEQQAQQQEQLAQRQKDLDAREKALADSQSAAANQQPVSTPRQRRVEVESDSERGPAASYNLFYTRLERYGSWLETRDYGYVWQPRDAGASSWRPYLNGHWVYTDAGWTWVSEEPFGWATYHYGRWTRLRNVGWVWVPGDEWAPAWVSWRKGDDYVGWAPLPPEAQFDRHTGIHNWADNSYDIGPSQYCFVPTARLGTTRMEQTVVSPDQNVTIINRTTNVTNITYNNVTVVNQGPNYDELRGRTEQPIPRLKLERQVAVETNVEPHEPIVRGETIQMIAPMVRRAQVVERPREVRQKITETTVDRGWAEVGDTEAGRQARSKMKSEAPPPPEIKTMSRTESPESPAVSGSQPPSAAAPVIETRNSPSPAADHGSSTTGSTPATSPPIRSASPRASATASATITPARQSSRPLITPAPTAEPSASTAAAASPRASVSPSPSAVEDNEPPRVGGRLKSQAKKFNPTRIEPMPTGGPEAGGSGSPVDTGRPPVRPRPEGLRRKPGSPPQQNSGDSPGATDSASPRVSPSPSGTP